MDREPGRVEGFEELAERLPETLRVGQPGQRVGAFEPAPPLVVVSSRCAQGLGERFEVGREPGRGRVGDEPGDPGGAVDPRREGVEGAADDVGLVERLGGDGPAWEV